MKQTFNAKRPTPNAQFGRACELEVERCTLDVGRFLALPV